MSTRRLTTKQFIERSKKIHNGRYDYSMVEYKNSSTKVNIICPEHGFFDQIPNNHLKGAICKRCSDIKKGIKLRVPKEHFFKTAKEVHGETYDYSKVEYIDNNTKVEIICKVHGSFYQTPYSHLNGSKCRKCANFLSSRKKLYNNDLFIKKSIDIHGNKYDYSLVEYKTSASKVKIICKKHGVFSQLAHHHMRGVGCTECKNELTSNRGKQKPTGWDVSNWQKAGERSNNFDSFKVYIIKCWNDSETFYKIGRTFNTIQRRFKSRMPYSYEIVKEFIFDNARDAFNKEADLKRLNKEFKYIPLINFDGQYECFNKILHNLKS